MSTQHDPHAPSSHHSEIPARESRPTTEAAHRPRRRRRSIVLLASALALALTAVGGATWAADRFLVPKVEIADVTAYEASTDSTGSDTASKTSESGDDQTATTATDTSADSSTASADAAISVRTETTGSGDNTVTYYVADVQLGDATELRSAFANNQFGENITEKTSEIAAENGATFAINGDYYGFRDTGIVIRNGVIYRDEPARTGIAFTRDGEAKIFDETQTSAEELLAQGVWNTMSFGPALVDEGAIVSGIDDVEVDTNFGNHSIQGAQPRTAVGVIDENHLVFVVVDGRDSGYSRGVTMTELAEIMQGLGAETAYNLDGGGSSTMYYNGEVVNQPSNGGERATSDIFYVAG
ncbi:phosphodiester glycosidase family protein [Leucobacter sp. USHLN153]|uniref:phosphodiester glycosidase family protein n=1 Tax=Leucobacter sp. USHLN153 TaxID=3081268 RepID=UPI003018B5D8